MDRKGNLEPEFNNPPSSRVISNVRLQGVLANAAFDDYAKTLKTDPRVAAQILIIEGMKRIGILPENYEWWRRD